MTEFMRHHPLVSFFVLAFAIGWSPWPLHAAGVLPGTNFLPIAPLVAALIVIPVVAGRAGLRELGSRMIRWRVPWYCYLAAIALPLTVIFGTAWLNVQLGGAAWSLSSIGWGSVAATFAVRWINPLDGPLGEEPGWRGFAFPRLQSRWSPLWSAMVLGALVAVWHLPLLFSTEGNPVGWAGLPTTFMITIVYCWLFNRSHGSVLLTMLFHTVQGTITVGTFGYTGADVERTLWLGLGAWTIVAAALVLMDRPAWRTAPAVRPAAPVLTTAVMQVSG
nr:type II CAAX endopeptidase family protein [uncultured Actinoplanes sp.]